MDKFNLYTNKIIYFALLFISISFPFSFKISNLSIALLVIIWIVRKLVCREKIQFNLKEKYTLFSFIAFLMLFALQVISLVYTEDKNLGIKFLEYKLSFLVLPIIIADLNLTKKKIINLLKYFVYSIVVISVYLIVNSCINYFVNGTLLTYHSFTELSVILDVHAVFYSYYIYFVILIMVYLYSTNQLEINKKYIALMGIPLVVSLVFAASKNVTVITLLSVLLYLIANSIRKIKWKEIIVSIAVMVVSGFLVSKIPIVKERITELKDLSGMENLKTISNDEKLTIEQRESFNGTSLRLALWYIGCKEVIDNNRIMIGLSPGDSKAIINKKYDELGLYPWYENYNMHNQYVQVFVEFGVVGLTLYLAFIVLLLISAVKNRNSLLLIFIMGFSFFQLTESLLERNKGILFFVFFLLLLLKMNTITLNEDSNTRDKRNT